jgi:hypothetical protein
MLKLSEIFGLVRLLEWLISTTSNGQMTRLKIFATVVNRMTSTIVCPSLVLFLNDKSVAGLQFLSMFFVAIITGSRITKALCATKEMKKAYPVSLNYCSGSMHNVDKQYEESAMNYKPDYGIVIFSTAGLRLSNSV